MTTRGIVKLELPRADPRRVLMMRLADEWTALSSEMLLDLHQLPIQPRVNSAEEMSDDIERLPHVVWLDSRMYRASLGTRSP